MIIESAINTPPDIQSINAKQIGNELKINLIILGFTAILIQNEINNIVISKSLGVVGDAIKSKLVSVIIKKV